MNSNLFLAIAMFALVALSPARMSSAPASAQGPNQGPSPQASDATAPPASADSLMPGTVLSVELSKSLDSKKSKANDKIEAKTATDLLVHGQIVVPRNTKIIGHITEAKAHSKASSGSMVGITFDRMLLKGGRQVPLQATVQAIARPLQINSVGNESDALADAASGMPGRRPVSAADSTAPSIPPKYPTSSIPEPPGLNAPNTSTVSPLGPTSRGVVGMKGLSLQTAGPVSVLTSNTGNVHLDSGAQLMLRVQ